MIGLLHCTLYDRANYKKASPLKITKFRKNIAEIKCPFIIFIRDKLIVKINNGIVYNQL